MLQYVNGFYCAVDNQKEDFILNFVQRNPRIDDEGIQDEMVTETVASLVMGKTVAQNLLTALGRMLETENDNNEEK